MFSNIILLSHGGRLQGKYGTAEAALSNPLITTLGSAKSASCALELAGLIFLSRNLEKCEARMLFRSKIVLRSTVL